jgi:hypothetical protein
MFVCIATKPLNDRTRGFRFNFYGQMIGVANLLTAAPSLT